MAPFKSSWPPPYMSCQGGAAPKEATYFIHRRCHTSKGIIYTGGWGGSSFSLTSSLTSPSPPTVQLPTEKRRWCTRHQRAARRFLGFVFQAAGRCRLQVLPICLFSCNLQWKSFTRWHTLLLIHLLLIGRCSWSTDWYNTFYTRRDDK